MKGGKTQKNSIEGRHGPIKKKKFTASRDEEEKEEWGKKEHRVDIDPRLILGWNARRVTDRSSREAKDHDPRDEV